MIKDKKMPSNYYGDEAPGWKDVLIVLIIVAALMAIAWLGYFKFGWFH
jgi:hypothetical protein